MKDLETADGTIHSDLSVTTAVGKQISPDKMQEIATAYKGMNRIHKPFLLLAWIDYKNGKRSNWEDK